MLHDGAMMKIGELSRESGCKVVTIRYYEKEGLLPSPERSEGNYRVYTSTHLERLRFIRHCRKHGMNLDEIRKLLAFRDQPLRDCTWVSDLVAEHIRNVDEQIASLEHLKFHLEQLKQECGGGHNGEACGIMQRLDSKAPCCESCPRCAQ